MNVYKVYAGKDDGDMYEPRLENLVTRYFSDINKALKAFKKEVKKALEQSDEFVTRDDMLKISENMFVNVTESEVEASYYINNTGIAISIIKVEE